MESRIIELIKEKGPLTGQQTLDSLTIDGLDLWRTVLQSGHLYTHSIARHYLRLDRRVKGFARLSPSIFREFLTYTVIGLSGDPSSIMQKAEQLQGHIREVSEAKRELAYRVISGISSRLATEEPLERWACVILAGDIVFNMAHDVPRPERSTGKLVRGSDLDLVVIVQDDTPKELRKRLDDAIYNEKYRLLTTPHIMEEIDYVVKDIKKVQEQLRFDSFRHMVACKILQEGILLYGSRDVYNQVMDMLEASGVDERLKALEARAHEFRANAVACLLGEVAQDDRGQIMCLFYPTEESEEFE